MKTTKKYNWNSHGTWKEKPRRMEILTCKCGNKYIKTRVNQKVCLTCLLHKND